MVTGVTGKTELQEMLFSMKDERYGDFSVKLIPGMKREDVIGVRIPDLRRLAKKYAKDPASGRFLNSLPHRFHEENLLHAFLIEEKRDLDCIIYEVERFLPYVTNWAVCDSMLPKAFSGDPEKTEKKAFEWMQSSHEYTVRYGIGVLMRFFLDGRFDPKYNEAVAAVKSDRYYVLMMQAWYFATALAKQYEATIGYLENGRFEKWLHNKTIQKAVESYRVTDEHKAYLRTLRKK